MILFVTAFRDIGRGAWSHSTRTIEKYISYFKNLAETIEYPLIVFATHEVILQIAHTVRNKDTITFVDSSTISIFLDTHLESERAIMNSDKYKRKIPEHRKIQPEHTNPEYTLLTHSKAQYVSHAKRAMPGYTHYAWIDFGFVRDNLDVVPKNIDSSKLCDKIMINSFSQIKPPYIDADTMLTSNAVYFAGGTFVVPVHLVDTFEALYTELLSHWKETFIADDDQSAIYQIYCANKSLFVLIPTYKWFSLYKEWLNTPLQLYKINAKRIGVVIYAQPDTRFNEQHMVRILKLIERVGYSVDILVQYTKESPSLDDAKSKLSYIYRLSYIDISTVRFSDYGAILFSADLPSLEYVERIKEAGVPRILIHHEYSSMYDCEEFLYQNDIRGPPFHRERMFDEIWITDCCDDASYDYCSVLHKHKVPVRKMPHVWNPMFINYLEHGTPMNKVHTGTQLDIVIQESNLSYNSNGWMALIVCEKLWLENPELLHHVYLFNAPDANATAMSMIQSLELWKSQKLRIMVAFPLLDLLQYFSDPCRHGDHPVVFLQHGDSFKSAAFDVLYAGFTLVHNSRVLKQMGFGHYYDTLASAKEALAHMPVQRNVSNSISQVHARLFSYDPFHESRLMPYKRRIDELMAIRTIEYTL